MGNRNRAGVQGLCATVALLTLVAGCAGGASSQSTSNRAMQSASTVSGALAVHGLRGQVSQSVTISGGARAPVSFDLAALKALPASSLTVSGNVFTGVDLWSLVNRTSASTRPEGSMNASVVSVLKATGTDGYKAMLSLAELDPEFGGRPALIAYAVNGASLGRSGDMRLIVSGDAKMGRSVSNLMSIELLRP